MASMRRRFAASLCLTRSRRSSSACNRACFRSQAMKTIPTKRTTAMGRRVSGCFANQSTMASATTIINATKHPDTSYSRCLRLNPPPYLVVPAPPSIVMLAPPEISRNASRTQSEGPRYKGMIRNPVVEYTYAKEDRVVASCDYGRVGAPLQESEGPRRTLSPSDRMAAERGKEDRGGVRGHRLQPRLGAQNSPPLQRVGSGRAGRPSPLQPRRQGEGAAG